MNETEIGLTKFTRELLKHRKEKPKGRAFGETKILCEELRKLIQVNKRA